VKRWFGLGELPPVAEQRAQMVERQLVRRGIRDERVLAAMGAVPRERFLPNTLAGQAYADKALPIGRGQTMSQPYIVARMTEALGLPAWQAVHGGRRPRVLDVGTGSGYQAAVLAQMDAAVVSIERDEHLAEAARRILEDLGYDVRVLVGDGSEGVSAEAPFAAIVVAAAAPEVPAPLVAQLEPDGRLVVPVGSRREQQMVLVQREGDGHVIRPLEPAVFVPLVGGHGFGGP